MFSLHKPLIESYSSVRNDDDENVENRKAAFL